MTNFIIVEKSSVVLATRSIGERPVYSIEAAARISEVHPDLVRYYCRSGMLGETLSDPQAELFFDDDAIYELRRIEHYRRHYGVSRRALPLINRLLRDIARLEAEVRFRRNP